MFALSFSCFINKVNRIFRFCFRRSSLFKKLFDYKDISLRHERKSWALWCKIFFILRNATGHYQRILRLSQWLKDTMPKKKERLVDTLKLFFTSYKLIQWALLALLSQGKGLTLEMDMVCKFPAQFYAREKKNILKIQKTVELVLIIIACTLEILSVKYEKYQYCHWNTCLSSFFPWQCFKKTSSNSKCNGFICFLYFFYLRSLKAKYRSLVVRKITRAVDKDKQLAETSILKAMMMLKRAWDEMTEQTIRNCFWKSGISSKTEEGAVLIMMTHLEGWWMMVMMTVLWAS